MFCSLRFRQILERIAVADFGSLKLRFIYFGEYSSWREERCGFGGERPNLSRHVALDFDILITKGDSCVWPYLILGNMLWISQCAKMLSYMCTNEAVVGCWLDNRPITWLAIYIVVTLTIFFGYIRCSLFFNYLLLLIPHFVTGFAPSGGRRW